MKDIKAELYIHARELFGAQGFKGTGVSDITKAVGIGTGTFYNYYTSKEDLFMAIYVEENKKLKQAIMQSIDLDRDPLSVIRELLLLNLDGMKSNPILKEWYNKDIFGKIEQRFREKKGLEHLNFMYDGFLEVVSKWQTLAKMRSDIEPAMIMAIFTAIISIETHKEEIGLQYFPQLIEYLTEFTIKGLTVSKT